MKLAINKQSRQAQCTAGFDKIHRHFGIQMYTRKSKTLLLNFVDKYFFYSYNSISVCVEYLKLLFIVQHAKYQTLLNFNVG